MDLNLVFPGCSQKNPILWCPSHSRMQRKSIVSFCSWNSSHSSEYIWCACGFGGGVLIAPLPGRSYGL